MQSNSVLPRLWWRGRAFVAVASLLLGACVTTMGNEEANALTPAEKDLRTRTEQQRVAQAAATGAIALAILGAVAGAAIGARSGNAGAGALIGGAGGAVAGGLMGAAYGSYVNAKARNYSNAEARANALAAEADKDIANYTAINNSSRQILADEQAKVAHLTQEYQAKRISKEAFQKGISSAKNNANIMKDQVKAMDDQIADMEADRQTAQLTNQVQQLKEQRDSLKDTYERLIQLYGTVPNDLRPIS